MQGYSLERLRDYNNALRYYVTASTLDPKHAKAFFGLGDIYMVTDKAQNAVTAYEKGLALDPGNKRAAKSLESARIKLKAQRGESVTSDEAVTVLFEEKSKDREITPIEATILRLLVLFPGKSTELPEEGADQLSIVGARAFTSHDLQGAVFEVVGNTDDSGDAKANLAISKKRAEAVRNYLIKNCNIDPKKLQVAAYDHTHPIVPNSTEQNRKINNRVEFKRVK
jgi:outer membrane protein OmpA-like peptidoglycan-associated protein